MNESGFCADHLDTKSYCEVVVLIMYSRVIYIQVWYNFILEYEQPFVGQASITCALVAALLIRLALDLEVVLGESPLPVRMLQCCSDARSVTLLTSCLARQGSRSHPQRRHVSCQSISRNSSSEQALLDYLLLIWLGGYLKVIFGKITLTTWHRVSIIYNQRKGLNKETGTYTKSGSSAISKSSLANSRVVRAELPAAGIAGRAATAAMREATKSVARILAVWGYQATKRYSI